ncbi:MAG: DUF3185 family protein [Archangium sp.]|nr:DUF3185 family protein [Archangium sp.]
MFNLGLIRSLSIGVLGLGLGLAFYGFMASPSFGAGLAAFFTGKPTEFAIWLVVGGVATLAAGAVGLAASSARLRTVSRRALG